VLPLRLSLGRQEGRGRGRRRSEEEETAGAVKIYREYRRERSATDRETEGMARGYAPGPRLNVEIEIVGNVVNGWGERGEKTVFRFERVYVREGEKARRRYFGSFWRWQPQLS